MSNTGKFYINGEWVEPIGSDTVDVINPATEDAIGTIALGTHEDVDLAVAAAQNAFETFSQTTVEERLELLNKITEIIGSRSEDLATAITSEMGAPTGLAKAAQAGTGLFHFATTAGILANFSFEEELGKSLIVKEPVGVVGMITPWNWPINQIACKVAPALAAGCTMVLKPSEVAPLNAIIFAEIMHEAGVPAGVFNLVNGDGPTVGAYLSSHPGIDMMSFTGSTRAGIEVAKNAATTVKRVAQELGGKSANIILDDANLEEAVGRDAFGMCMNSGQSCNAGTRMLVPNSKMEEAKAIAKASMQAV
ncbi:MAG: aldehyde dehydrogenase family protein, partial [Actinomycetota bacterium]|nr:aldehyde dehydrogenase family protein [Actinomycetota bacterium]